MGISNLHRQHARPRQWPRKWPLPFLKASIGGWAAGMLSAVFSLVSAGALAQSDDEKPGLLIMAFTADGVAGRAAISAEDLTANAFARTGRFNVVAGNDLQQLMQLESAKASVGCSEGECIAEIAGALGADYVVTGRLSQLGKLFVLKLSLLEPAKARTVATETFQVNSLEDLAFELSLAGARMTKVAFGEEIPAELQRDPMQKKRQANAKEVEEMVDKMVEQKVHDAETAPLITGLIWFGWIGTSVGLGGWALSTVAFLVAAGVNYTPSAPGLSKAIARPVGMVVSFAGPLLLVVGLVSVGALGTGYILE